jgi:hypothetical protein
MTDKPFTLVKREDLSPVCFFNDTATTEIYTRSKGVPFIQGTNVVYFCPHCLKVLGFGQGRMI